MPGIIVGIDGSAHSRHALEWAINEAAIRRAPLTVLTVQQTVAGYWGTVPRKRSRPRSRRPTRCSSGSVTSPGRRRSPSRPSSASPPRLR